MLQDAGCKREWAGQWALLGVAQFGTTSFHEAPLLRHENGLPVRFVPGHGFSALF